jgi:ABC-2 type transport system permease protein
MKNFLYSQSYYLKKDSIFKAICYLILAASIIFIVWIGSIDGFDMKNPVESLSNIFSISILFYFIIPIHACIFSTEGFESGSIKNIIGSGQSRISYVIGKYISEIKVITWCLIQFFGLYYILFIIFALITGADIGNTGLNKDIINVLSLFGFNFLYLAAYCAIIMMVGLIVRNTASVSIFTFLIIFGDMMLSSYLKESVSTFLRSISSKTLMAQVMKFSNMYVVNGQLIKPTTNTDYFYIVIFPIIVITICLTIALINFNKRDI